MLKSLIDVFHKTDLFAILGKLREIDLLKYIILTPEQRQYMSYMQKEDIVYDEATDDILYYSKYKNIYSEENKKKLIEKFINKGKNGELSDEIDQKIFNCIDESLVS
jgi:hypothetical protein